MGVFADSSALVELYADEDGSAVIRALTDVVVSQVCRVEVVAALWREMRSGELEAGDVAVLVARFESDCFGAPDQPGRFLRTSITPDVLDLAARHAAVHGLRAYDAVQLASATAVVAVEPRLAHSAFHRSLRLAAAAEGFALVP